MEEINLNNPVSFSWDIHYACNYRCPYCWFNGDWHNLAKQNKYLPTGKLIEAWAKVYKNYGAVHIYIIGGEPFIYPDFRELIKELSKVHFIGITTNLSIGLDNFINEIDLSKVNIAGTFHPLFANFDNFVRNALILKESGMTNPVWYLAYPPQIRLINHYKGKFDKYGIPLSALTFWGEYNGIGYPQGYTEEEKAIIMPYLGYRQREKFQLGPKEVKGKLCKAGQIYANIKADGSVFRCSGAEAQLIGNLFSDDFRLLEEPLPCKSEFCPCNIWASLSLLIEDSAPDKEEKEKPALTEVAIKETAEKLPRFPRKDPPYRVYWSWDITYECNYKCSYCYFWKDKSKERYPFVEINRWKDIWDSIFEKYWCCHIRFSGGEPFVYPYFMNLIAALSEKHTVDVTTNLTFNLDLFLKKISPGGVTLSASFHPEFIGINEFLDKVVSLNENGFPTSVAFVAYPPHLKDLERYKTVAAGKRFFNEGRILFKVIPYIGELEGIKYPEGYSAQQKKLLEETAVNTELKSQRELNVQWLEQGDNEKRRKDKYCRMGQMYARIFPNGDVTRCCHHEAAKMGTIFDKDFRLLDEPAPCQIESCPCWKPMIVGYKEDKYPIFWEMPEHKIYKLEKPQS